MIKILVAANDVSIRHAVVRVISTEAYEIIESGSYDAAYDMAVSERPDAILLLVLKLGTSGLQVVDRLEEDPETSSTPIILLVGKDIPLEDLTERLRFTDLYYMTMPCKPSDLQNSVRTALQNQPYTYAKCDLGLPYTTDSSASLH